MPVPAAARPSSKSPITMAVPRPEVGRAAGTKAGDVGLVDGMK
jgi:hypothetical protein